MTNCFRMICLIFSGCKKNETPNVGISKIAKREQQNNCIILCLMENKRRIIFTAYRATLIQCNQSIASHVAHQTKKYVWHCPFCTNKKKWQEPQIYVFSKTKPAGSRIIPFPRLYWSHSSFIKTTDETLPLIGRRFSSRAHKTLGMG